MIFVSFTKAEKSSLRVRRKLIYTVQTHWIRNVTVKFGSGMMHEDGAIKINCLRALNGLLSIILLERVKYLMAK